MPQLRASIRYNETGQTLELYPRYGVPDAAATYAVWLDGQDLDEDPELSGTATADSVDTTFDAASGPGQTDRHRANVTSETGIVVGRLYWAETAAGASEEVPAIEVGSGYVRGQHPLANTYAASDTFKGHRQSFTVDSSFVQDESHITIGDCPWRVRWRYQVGSIQREEWTEFDIERITFETEVRFSDLVAIVPDLAYMEPAAQQGQQYKPQEQEARELVKELLAEQDVDIDNVLDQEGLHRCLVKGTIKVLAEAGIGPKERDLESYIAEKNAEFFATVRRFTNRRARIDKGTSGATTQRGTKKRRFIR